MRKLFIGVVLVFLIPLGAWAQQPFPKAEVFGGYSYFRLNPQEYNLNGWNASVVVNFKSWFGVEGDFSGYYGNPKENEIVIPEISLNSHTLMGGPKVTIRNDHFAPFAHFLIGTNRLGANFNSDVISDIALATAIGGGLDINVNKSLAIRTFQADYLMTRFDTNDDGTNDRQNNFRFSAGVVFKFGKL
jgi:opacity protein-like surface antigen